MEYLAKSHKKLGITIFSVLFLVLMVKKEMPEYISENNEFFILYPTYANAFFLCPQRVILGKETKVCKIAQSSSFAKLLQHHRVLSEKKRNFKKRSKRIFEEHEVKITLG